MSVLPRVAASVRTRVVSWKLAAEMKLVGLERGLGDAEEDGLGFGGLAALVGDELVLGVEGELVHLVAPEERRCRRDR